MKDPLELALLAGIICFVGWLSLCAYREETTPQPLPAERCAAACRTGELAGWTVGPRGEVECFCSAVSHGGTK